LALRGTMPSAWGPSGAAARAAARTDKPAVKPAAKEEPSAPPGYAPVSAVYAPEPAAESAGQVEENHKVQMHLPPIGEEVEGRYGSKWYAATLLEVSDSTLKVRWHFDKSEEEVKRDDIRVSQEARQAVLKVLEPMGGALAFLEATRELKPSSLKSWLDLLCIAAGALGNEEPDMAAWQELAGLVVSSGGPRVILELLKGVKAPVNHAAKQDAGLPVPFPEHHSAAADGDDRPDDPVTEVVPAAPALTKLQAAMAGVTEAPAADLEEQKVEPKEPKVESKVSSAEPSPVMKPSVEEPIPQPPAMAAPATAPVRGSWAAMAAAPPSTAKSWGKGGASAAKGNYALPPHPSIPAPRPPAALPPPPPSAQPSVEESAAAPANKGWQQPGAWNAGPAENSIPFPDMPEWQPPATEKADPTPETGDKDDAFVEDVAAAPVQAEEVPVVSKPVEAPAPAPAPASSSSVSWPAPAKAQQLDGVKLAEWLRRRVFQLRVNLVMGQNELMEVLQSLDDDKLQPPFEEAKLWLGLDPEESLPPALEQLISEFRDVRVRP